jgi:hypothetical protein
LPDDIAGGKRPNPQLQLSAGENISDEILVAWGSQKIIEFIGEAPELTTASALRSGPFNRCPLIALAIEADASVRRP